MATRTKLPASLAKVTSALDAELRLAEVPDYPASHGCLRTFIADQPRVYNITEIGMPVYTFGNAFRGRVQPYQVRHSGGDLGPDLGPTGGLDPTVLD